MAGLDEIKQKTLPILRKAKVNRAAIFGSYVRGEQREDSDIDMLVELPKSKSLFDFIGLQLELGESLGRKVDLGEYSTIKPRLKVKILSSALPIL